MAATGDSPERVDGPMEKAPELHLLPNWMVCLRHRRDGRLAAAGTAGGRRPPDTAISLVPSPGKQCRFVLAATLLGWLVDSGLAAAGVFTFPFGSGLAGLCPLWMAALWANFAGTLHLSLDWLRGRYWLASAPGRLRRASGLLWRSASSAPCCLVTMPPQSSRNRRRVGPRNTNARLSVRSRQSGWLEKVVLFSLLLALTFVSSGLQWGWAILGEHGRGDTQHRAARCYKMEESQISPGIVVERKRLAD